MLKRYPELSGFQFRFLLLGYSCPQPAMFAELHRRDSRASHAQGSSELAAPHSAQHSQLEQGLHPSGLAGDLTTLEHSSQRFRGTNAGELTHRKNRNARV